MEPTDPFYVGYQDEAPPAVGQFLKRLMLGGLLGAAVLAAVLVVGQQGFAASVFEFGNVRTFEGVIQAHPYPVLLVERPGDVPEAAAWSAYLLVMGGKNGAGLVAEAVDGQRVRLAGTLIYRDGQTMIEVTDGSVEALGAGEGPPPTPISLGTHTLVGEIVDSKCFYGVMNPGFGKPHRACASLCIRGGMPPVLAVTDAAGHTDYLLLQGEDGRTVNQEVLPMVAEPVSITGEVVQQGTLLFLKAEPASYQRLAP